MLQTIFLLTSCSGSQPIQTKSKNLSDISVKEIPKRPERPIRKIRDNRIVENKKSSEDKSSKVTDKVLSNVLDLFNYITSDSNKNYEKVDSSSWEHDDWVMDEDEIEALAKSVDQMQLNNKKMQDKIDQALALIKKSSGISEEDLIFYLFPYEEDEIKDPERLKVVVEVHRYLKEIKSNAEVNDNEGYYTFEDKLFKYKYFDSEEELEDIDFSYVDDKIDEAFELIYLSDNGISEKSIISKLFDKKSNANKNTIETAKEEVMSYLDEIKSSPNGISAKDGIYIFTKRANGEGIFDYFSDYEDDEEWDDGIEKALEMIRTNEDLYLEDIIENLFSNEEDAVEVQNLLDKIKRDGAIRSDDNRGYYYFTLTSKDDGFFNYMDYNDYIKIKEDEVYELIFLSRDRGITEQEINDKIFYNRSIIDEKILRKAEEKIKNLLNEIKSSDYGFEKGEGKIYFFSEYTPGRFYYYLDEELQ